MKKNSLIIIGIIGIIGFFIPAYFCLISWSYMDYNTNMGFAYNFWEWVIGKVTTTYNGDAQTTSLDMGDLSSMGVSFYAIAPAVGFLGLISSISLIVLAILESKEILDTKIKNIALFLIGLTLLLVSVIGFLVDILYTFPRAFENSMIGTYDPSITIIPIAPLIYTIIGLIVIIPGIKEINKRY